jgi:hypothetical protein
VQSGAGATNWTVHEIRALDAGRELPRLGWKATARPFPWGTDALLDGRTVSFWMSGEKLAPGQFVEIDLPSPQNADAVVVTTAAGQWDARMDLEVIDGDGQASRIDQPEVTDAPVPVDLRREAAKELRRRGIDYLLVFDDQFGADDLQTRTAEWGVRQVAEYKGARLYQLP